MKNTTVMIMIRSFMLDFVNMNCVFYCLCHILAPNSFSVLITRHLESGSNPSHTRISDTFIKELDE